VAEGRVGGRSTLSRQTAGREALLIASFAQDRPGAAHQSRPARQDDRFALQHAMKVLTGVLFDFIDGGFHDLSEFSIARQ